jgi:hypothetical protein
VCCKLDGLNLVGCESYGRDFQGFGRCAPRP